MELQQEEFDKILAILIQKGIDNTDLSMFSDDARIKLIKKAAEESFNNKNYPEAIKAYAIINDKEKINSLGDSFLKSGLLSYALTAYEIANNELMIRFIKQNFSEEDCKKKLYL